MKSCGPIKLYLQKQVVGQIAPVGCSLPTLELDQHNVNSTPKLLTEASVSATKLQETH